jgi:hypothetical protein
MANAARVMGTAKDGGHKGIVGGSNMGNVNGNEGGGQ